MPPTAVPCSTGCAAARSPCFNTAGSWCTPACCRSGDLAQTLALAGELQAVLGGPDWTHFLHRMYGNQPDAWRNDLKGADRLRVVVNALTRIRFCSAQGVMEFDTKDSAAAAPAGFMPWYQVPGRHTAGVPIAFGHWSTLGQVRDQNVLALDTGCVWGGCLTAARIGPATGQGAGGVELIEVKCPQAQKPGKP